MGQASKWIRNLLLGKQENKDKKLAVLEGPKAKRRWSFKRSHKTNKSFDSVDHERGPNLIMPVVPSTNAAATRIQAVYRSYLARRALRALRGLVKLQALVKGYLVRKQMKYVLRSMHAVMTIQVQARNRRVQMADQPARRSCKREKITDHGTREGLTRRASERMDRKQARRQDDYACSRLSVSHREYELNPCLTPSALSFTYSSSTLLDERRETTTATDLRHFSIWPENKQTSIVKSPYHASSDSHLMPNYMNNTKSSKAKDRSHSAPKQRPVSVTDQNKRRSSSIDLKTSKTQRPWSIKIYQSTKSTDDKTKSLIPFEPLVKLY